MKRRKWLALLLVSAVVVGMLAGCGSKSEDKESAGEEQTTETEAEQPKDEAADPADGSADSGAGGQDVAGILMALNADYWHMVKSGIVNGGADNGINVTVTGPTNEADVTGQIAMIEDQITAGVNGILLAPCDTKALLPTLEKCKEKDIPVVLIDMDLEEENQDLRATFIGTSEYEAGKMVGEYIIENFEPCKIGAIRGLAGLPSHDARVNGMRDVVTEKGFEVVTEQPADSERGKAVGVAENIMSATPDIKILYATNDEMALGAYQAVEGKQKTDDISVIGFNGDPDALKSIKEGKLKASLAQRPIEMGYKGVEALNTLFEGGTVETNIFTSTIMVTSENVEEFEADLAEQIERADAANK